MRDVLVTLLPRHQPGVSRRPSLGLASAVGWPRTVFAESAVLDVKPSQSKPDRGVVRVHGPCAKPGGALVAERAVLVPRRQPGG